MARNFLINLFFFIPVWVLKAIFIFNKDIKREYVFDIQSKALLSLMPKFEIHKISDNEIQELRELIEERRVMLRIATHTKKNIKKIDHYIGESENMKIREYIPYKTDNENIILYFHGGGYVLNSIETHDPTVSYFSEKLRTRIFSLEYSLSPEYKFPYALEEAKIALSWLQNRGTKIENISLCGDSAGAHLAASVTHHFAIEGKSNVHSQFLIYPMCDPKCESESIELFKDNYLLTKKAMKWFWEKFRGTENDNSNNSFNLMLYENNMRLPKTIIVTAGFDPLSDEAEEYAFKIHENNNYVKQLHYPSLFHGFASMTRLKSAKKAVDDFLIQYKNIL
tara:strand:- start:1177 stop:2187 length:1011 start_codon:yes stop_codon:yes gene_type:complete